MTVITGSIRFVLKEDASCTVTPEQISNDLPRHVVIHYTKHNEWAFVLQRIACKNGPEAVTDAIELFSRPSLYNKQTDSLHFLAWRREIQQIFTYIHDHYVPKISVRISDEPD